MKQCGCGRGEFNPDKYHTCYECYLDRRSQYIDCVFCGRWHSPRYSTCFACRTIPGRDEAARNLRFDILVRDGFRCRACGSYEQPEVDHIKPCAAGGVAAPWNLQVLCHACNQAKGTDWENSWLPTRVELMALYLTFGWVFLEPDEQTRLVEEARKYHTLHHYSRVATQPQTPAWAIAMADADG